MLDTRRKMTIRLTTEQAEKIYSNVNNAGMTINEFVIRACLGKKINPMPKEKKILLNSLYKTFLKIGNNLNQLARLANQQKNANVVSSNLQQMSKEISEIWQFLKQEK